MHDVPPDAEVRAVSAQQLLERRPHLRLLLDGHEGEAVGADHDGAIPIRRLPRRRRPRRALGDRRLLLLHAPRVLLERLFQRLELRFALGHVLLALLELGLLADLLRPLDKRARAVAVRRLRAARKGVGGGNVVLERGGGVAALVGRQRELGKFARRREELALGRRGVQFRAPHAGRPVRRIDRERVPQLHGLGRRRERPRRLARRDALARELGEARVKFLVLLLQHAQHLGVRLQLEQCAERAHQLVVNAV